MRISRDLHTSCSFSLVASPLTSRSLARSCVLCPSLYTHRAGIRQLSSIEATQGTARWPPSPSSSSSSSSSRALSPSTGGDLAVKSRLRAAHDTLNPRLVDPETFNLDVTACCQEEISLYSRDTPSRLPRGQVRSGSLESLLGGGKLG